MRSSACIRGRVPEFLMAKDSLELEKVLPIDQRVPLRPGSASVADLPSTFPPDYGLGERDDRARLREIWRVIRKRIWLIAVVAVIATTVVTVEIYRTKSIYQASAVLEFGRENATYVRSGEVVIQPDDSDDYLMTTKILVLRSTPLLEDVVVNLKLDKNPRLLDINRRKSYWEALGTVLGRVQKMVQRDENMQPEAFPALTPLRRSGGELIRTPEETARLAPFVGVLQGNLSAEQVQFSRALTVSFSHTDPVIAAIVANGVAEAFVQRNYRNKTERYTNASAWLDRTTRELKARVEQAEQALADYGREHNIFTTDGKETLTSEKFARLHEQVLRAETDRILKQSLYEEVKLGHVAQLPESFADARTSALQTKLGEITTEAAQLSVKFGPDNPKIIELREQIAAIRQQIEANRATLEAKLKADYERAAREEAALKSAFERSKTEAVEQNQASIQYNILKQDIDTTKTLYTDFLQKTNQANIEVAQQHNNVRLIEPAHVPGGPISPNRPRTIMIGLLVSLLAGVGLAFAIEYVDNTVKSVEDVNRYARLPVLGVVPALGSDIPQLFSVVRKGIQKVPGKRTSKIGDESEPDKLMMVDSNSPLGEAYRVIRTSLLLSSGSASKRVILVTSGQPGEGKTTTVINTGVALAQLGASVLIIDADLRRPKAHKSFGVSSAQGLSTYLSSEIEVDELIHRLPVPNLSLLPCGPIPPNPAELLSSQRMRDLLADLSSRYDHILIDSPPLISVTDPVILSTLVNGVVLVVHAGKTTRDVVRRARQELANVGARTIGVVLNNLDLRRDAEGDYYRGRYYSSYGEGEKR